jgi:hypothetical protein
VVKEMAQRRIQSYERTIREYEARYGSWDRFREYIQGKATPEQEDQWMEWEAARNMLKAWRELEKELA